MYVSLNVLLMSYFCWLLCWRYISWPHSPDELQLERNSCALLRSCFIGSCHVGVSKRFSRSISLAVYCLYIFFWLIRSLVDPTLAAFYRMQSLAVYVTHILLSLFRLVFGEIKDKKPSSQDSLTFFTFRKAVTSLAPHSLVSRMTIAFPVHVIA